MSATSLMRLAGILFASAAFVDAQFARGVCILSGTLDNEVVAGTITFTAVAPNVLATYSITGLVNGSYSLGLHQSGSLHSTDGSALAGPSTIIPIQTPVNGASSAEDVTIANVTLLGDDSIIGRGASIFDDTGFVVAQCVVGRTDADVTVSNNADGVLEADCIFVSLGQQNAVSTGDEAGFARFFQRPTGLDIEIWASGFVADGTYPFAVTSIGNLGLASTAHSIFVGESFTPTGTRMFVGELSPSLNRSRGLRSDTRFGSWTFSDALPSLNGANSIVGRTLVLFNKLCSTDDLSLCTAAAQCVVGIVEPTIPGVADGVQRAHAVMDPTPANIPANSVTGVVGAVDFIANEAQITVRYFFTGLQPGGHTWHIHRLGDLSSPDGSALMGHFIGDCSNTLPCRMNETRGPDEPPVLQEVGAIDGNAPIIANSRGVAYGEFDDPVITLNGARSVVGRGIIVHDVDPAIRVSQGVIGRAAETVTISTQEIPEVFEAICVLQPTGQDAGFDAAGTVQFSQPRGGNMTITYDISNVETGDLPWGIYDYGFLLSVQDGLSVGERFDAPGVGAFNGGVPLTTVNGAASGQFDDSELSFAGETSIIGRSVAIKSPDDSAVVAMCAIGIQEEIIDRPRLVDRVAGVEAICTLQPTRLSPNQTLTGVITFSQTLSNVEISYNIQGLVDGEHSIHVHTLGSLFSTDGSATGPHFPGDCNVDNPCRPENATEQTVGYIGDGFDINSTNGMASGMFIDEVIEFRGVNSIIGRGIIIHGDGVDSGARVAQCVIGRNNDEGEFLVEEASNSAGVTEADCIFTPVGPSQRASGQETGYARFSQNNEDGGVDVEIWVDGFQGLLYHPLELRQRGNIQNANAPGDTFIGTNDDGLLLGELSRNQLQRDVNQGLRISDNGEMLHKGSWSFNDPLLSLNGENSIIGRTFSIRSSVPEGSGPNLVVAQCVVGIAKENGLPAGVLRLSFDLTVSAEILGGVDLDVASTGSGSATVTYDPNIRQLSWDIRTSGLTSDLTQLHFHGPARRSMGGTLQVNATAVGAAPLGNMGSTTLTEAQARDLTNGLWYINVHTVSNPRGELRGQVAPRDVTLTVPLTVEAEVTGGVVLNQPTLGTGVAEVVFNPISRVLMWNIELTEPTLRNLVQVHFHGPASRFMGGALQVNATALGMSLSGQTTLLIEQSRDLLDGLWYINIHTVQNPSGELRGQIAPPVGVYRAHAVMEPAADSPLTTDVVRGTVDFFRAPGASAVTVRYFFTGLAPGQHTWHIHQFGNITSPTGAAVGGHFIGNCGAANPCRPQTSLQEVGAIEDSVPIIADENGNSYDVFTDSVIDLSGINSIIGRGIIVHDIDPMFRVSQGVIGIAGENPVSREFTFEVSLQPLMNLASTGTGSILVEFNPSTNELRWSLNVSDLSSATTRAAFHGPANRTMDGIEQVVIAPMTFASPSSGMAIITDAQASDLLTGMWYVLVSTVNNANGELRGQVAQDAVFEMTVQLTIGQEVAGGVTVDSATVAANRASGEASISYNLNTGLLTYSFELRNLSSAVTRLHFHGPATRFMGGALQVDVTAQGVMGEVTLNETQAADLLNGLWYINIHTETNPNGEIRGQIAELEPIADLPPSPLTSAAVERAGGVVTNPTLSNVQIWANYDPNTDVLNYLLLVPSLQVPNPPQGFIASFHAPASENETAGVVLAITLTNGASTGPVRLRSLGFSQASIDQLLAGQWYVLVSTPANPDGEVRLQMIFEPEVTGSTPGQGQDAVFPTVIREAACNIAPTALQSQFNAAGSIRFSRADDESAMTVSYRIEQISVGDHPWNIRQFGNLMSNQDGLSTGDILIGNVNRPGGAIDFAGAIDDVGDGDGNVIRFVGAAGSQNGVAERLFMDEFLQFAGPNSIIGRSVVIQDVSGQNRIALCTIGISAEGDLDVPVVTTNPQATTAATQAPTPTMVNVADSSAGVFPQWTVHLVTTFVAVITLVLH